MSTIPAATTLDIALRTAQAALLGLGVVTVLSGLGLLPKRRRQRRPDAPSTPRAVMGFALLAGGLVVMGVRAMREGSAPADVISSTRFSSSVAPTLSLEAPANWLLSHDPANGRLVATGPQASLMIETSAMSEGVDPARFLGNLSKIVTSGGGTDEGAFEETLDGLTASGRSFKYETTSQAAWYVPRGGPLVTTISCRSDGQASGRDACRPVLSALKWRPPGPL